MYNESIHKSNDDKCYNPMSEIFQEDAKRLGLTGNEYIQKLKREGKIKKSSQVDDEWAKKRGFKNYSDYQNNFAASKGYRNHWEYQKASFWNNAKRGGLEYFKGRVCSICGNNESRYGWYNDDKEGHLCGKCARKKYYYITDWRIGELDPYSTTGKGFIGQQIIAKRYEIEDCNLIMDNFNFYVDLSKHSLYGMIQVKTATLIANMWSLNHIRNNKFDTLFCVCMDKNQPWTDVKKIYIIPLEELIQHECEKGIYVYDDWSKVKYISRFEWVEKFKVDHKPFNDIYHNMKLENCRYLRS